MANRVVCGALSVLMALSVLACSSKPPVLTINERQTLVLDASLLAAGITASKPDLTQSSSGTQATAQLSNATAQPVTVNYRFYWYDASGLDVLPYEEVRRVVVPPQAMIRIAAAHPGQDIRQVRLYLFL